MQYIPAKTIINAVKPSPHWFLFNYNMNIYRGCCHGCIYCDSRSDCYRIEDFDAVRAKKDALVIIEKELRSKRKKGIIATGAMSDPYNPFEEDLLLTRKALQLVDKYKFGISIATKSPLVARDADILKKISSHSNVIVKMTITCADDNLSKKIEPFAPVSSERFKALKELSQEGVFAGILMMPLLPFINDTKENILSVIHRGKAAGVKFIFPAFGLTLRANQRDYFYKEIDKLFPAISQKYIKAYGGAYACASPKENELYAIFKQECAKLGIIYKMKDIIGAYQTKKEPQQLTLF